MKPMEILAASGLVRYGLLVHLEISRKFTQWTLIMQKKLISIGGDERWKMAWTCSVADITWRRVSGVWEVLAAVARPRKALLHYCVCLVARNLDRFLR
jgi:hypothetical protein